MSEENGYKPSERTLGLTPTWSVATVLTVFVVVSLIVERSIYRLSNVSGYIYLFISLHIFRYVKGLKFSHVTMTVLAFEFCFGTVVAKDKEKTFICCIGENERRFVDKHVIILVICYVRFCPKDSLDLEMVFFLSRADAARIHIASSYSNIYHNS